MLGNNPLIYYTIKESLKSNVSRTIVSTDSIKIANMAKKFGAEIPFLRPKKYSLNDSSSISVILHCLDYLKKNENYVPDYIVFLQPTSPFRTYKDINAGLKKIIHTKHTSLVSITEVSQHPFWMFKKKDNMILEFLKEKNKPLRRQELPKLYYISDALYITKTDYFFMISQDQPVFNLKDLTWIELPILNSFDINTKLDFEIARCLCKIKGQKIWSYNNLRRFILKNNP